MSYSIEAFPRRPILISVSLQHVHHKYNISLTPSKAPVVSLSKKLYHHCLVLVGFRNGFQRYFTMELKLRALWKI